MALEPSPIILLMGFSKAREDESWVKNKNPYTNTLIIFCNLERSHKTLFWFVFSPQQSPLKTPAFCVLCVCLTWRTKKTQLQQPGINLSAMSARLTHQSTSAQVALYALVASHVSKLTSNALLVRARGTRPTSSRSLSSTIISSSLVLFFFFFFSHQFKDPFTCFSTSTHYQYPFHGSLLVFYNARLSYA